MIALLAHPVARVTIIAVLSMAFGVFAASKYYNSEINSIQLEYQLSAEKAKAESAEAIATGLKKNEELTHEYQKDIDSLRSRYAAARVRVKASGTADLPETDAAAGATDSPKSGGLSVGVGTLELLEQCDLNTQKLLGLQAWHSGQ